MTPRFAFPPPPTLTLPVHIRWMVRRDMPEVMAIERASFNPPCSEEEFLGVLRYRSNIGMVAEHDEAVVGFMVYALARTSLRILNFAVHPARRRRGVGRQMVARLVSRLSSHRRTRIDLRVRETNLPGQRFFAVAGFRAVGVDREHYEDTGEDAYLMRYTLPEERP